MVAPRPTGRWQRADRTAAVIAGMRAYDDGDFFEAHELMEPAWMGTDDPAERELIQGLIKLAAADVHGGARQSPWSGTEPRGRPRSTPARAGWRRDRRPAVRPARACSMPSIGAWPSWPRTGPPSPIPVNWSRR